MRRNQKAKQDGCSAGSCDWIDVEGGGEQSDSLIKTSKVGNGNGSDSLSGRYPPLSEITRTKLVAVDSA